LALFEALALSACKQIGPSAALSSRTQL